MKKKVWNGAFIPDGNSEMYYSYSSQENRCIGHLRGYFSGEEFYNDWFPHAADATRNNSQFKSEFYHLGEDLMKTNWNTKGLAILWQCGEKIGETDRGLKMLTDHYEFYLRIPAYIKGNYIYIYCYEREEC